MSKKITIIGINYYPEDSAIGLYTTQKAEYLVKAGFHVTVVTGFPYYPQWEIRKDYKTKPYLLKETINGVNVLRSKQYVPRNPTFFKRIIHLTSFTHGNFINLFRISKPDVVIAIIPFTTSALLGWFLKLRYNSKLWVHIQDFEFDAAIDSGLLSGKAKTVFNGLLWIEKKLLSKADVVSTISHGMINKLQEKTKVNTYYLTNWIDISLFDTIENEIHPYLKSDNFKILYSGNIGAKQDWELFFSFINELRNIKNIEVVVVGEGAEKEMVINKLKRFSFVKHFNLVPFEELPLLLSSADLHILFQKTDVIDTVMPSKLLGMMASGKPSIVTGNLKSEVATIFKESEAGYYFKGNSINEIIKHVNLLVHNKDLSRHLGKNAKQYVNMKYSQKEVLDKFIRELLKI
ncbi:putative glycosyl transferase [Mariniflexile rhizosphaerae]|uniref:WcaI family glycosyltransferase n=1 Tax=unclassified Mariniflexile TaxID=2643887 RepID=UPI000CAE4838|nr:WcaI family glycosyltransferase [Mariniflexile sp. TRM1-10]AXP80578.1 putative glycosyl transferase [Mariniflexile sp. TRM1-10]PLB20122.1 MAG: Glycosyl transferase family 1 [Flavobacteriaceae bacterium FS1-H7996/R]